MTTIIHTSDLHGNLPNIPQCDILTISGDICPNFSFDLEKELTQQIKWLRTEFSHWLKSQPIGHTIATWGNHDFIGEITHKVDLNLPVTFLVDELVTYKGIKLYGTPWTKTFGQWAFMKDEAELKEKFDKIQPCDVLLSHGPAYTYGDFTRAYPHMGKFVDENAGSPSLLENIEKIRPQLTLYGHIHPGFGLYHHQGLRLANISFVDNENKPKNKLLKTIWENNKLITFDLV